MAVSRHQGGRIRMNFASSDRIAEMNANVPKSRHIRSPQTGTSQRSREFTWGWLIEPWPTEPRHTPMRIAQISPLFEAVPPKLYGGTERVVYSLTEELVALGHDVTLFASGDSITSAKLAPMRDQALRLDPSVVDWIAIYLRMMELIYRRADEFDVLHFHTDYFPLSLFSRQKTPFLTTLHGRLDIPEFKGVYELFDAPMVSISDSQRRPIPRLNWIRTVHHGMPADLLTPQPVKQQYLAFLGRISPEKGVDKAIRIAGA